MSALEPSVERIRELNDAFRVAGPASGDWFLTPGVRALGEDTIAAIVGQLRAFDSFIPEDDHYGEHDFGSLRQDGEKLFWKIDLYDPGLVKFALNGSFC